MSWSRRSFLRTASLAVVGGIFVPKYERWFRPLEVRPIGLSVPWPEAMPGDLAVMTVMTTPGKILRLDDDTPRGWTFLARRIEGRQEVAVFHRLVDGTEPPVRLPRRARAGGISTFRNVAAVGVDEVPSPTDETLWLAPHIGRRVPIYLGTKVAHA